MKRVALSDGLDLRGYVAATDALHTRRAHAEFLHARGVEFIMIAKENQSKLFACLDAVDWEAVPVGHRTDEHDHGHHEIRTIKIADAPPGLPFPHVDSVFLVERYTRRPTRKNGKTTWTDSAVAVLGVTSLSKADSTPAQVATHVRNHWGVEVRHEVAVRREALRTEGGARPSRWAVAAAW